MNYNSIIMEYQKIIKLLQNISINQVNLEQKYQVEINDKSRGTYNINSQARFENSMLSSIYVIIVMNIYF